MAWIPDEEMERLKARISLERLAEAKGWALRPRVPGRLARGRASPTATPGPRASRADLDITERHVFSAWPAALRSEGVVVRLGAQRVARTVSPASALNGTGACAVDTVLGAAGCLQRSALSARTPRTTLSLPPPR
jgi:hypothetical protein